MGKGKLYKALDRHWRGYQEGKRTKNPIEKKRDNLVKKVSHIWEMKGEGNDVKGMQEGGGIIRELGVGEVNNVHGREGLSKNREMGGS